MSERAIGTWIDVAAARDAIDRVDDRIAKLLAERSLLVRSAQEAKRAAGLPRRDQAMEIAVLARGVDRHRLAGGAYADHTIRRVFRALLDGHEDVLA